MNVGLLSPSHSELVSSYGKPTKDLYPAVGNLGNLLFREAVAEHVNTFVRTDGSIDPKEASEEFDIIVMPLANMLTPWVGQGMKLWATATADFLEGAKLPVMALGVGAQANRDASPRLALGPEITRLIRVISDHSATIGVRGEFSADVLKEIGVENTSVVGCPSNFLSVTADLGSRIQKKQENRPPHRLVFTGKDFDFNSMGIHQHVQRRLLDYTELHGGFYVVQAEEAAIRLTRMDRDMPDSVAYRSNLRDYLRPWESNEEFGRRVSQRFISFPNVAGCLEFLSSIDLSVGMRIHGSIAATQAGVPSLTIAHDMRTLELCETLGLPNITPESFYGDSSLADSVERHQFNGAEYNRKRIELATVYQSIYHANGLVCHFPFDFNEKLEESPVLS